MVICVNLKHVGPQVMTVTLNLPPEKEAAFKAQAQARRLSLEEWMLEACAPGFRCPFARRTA